MKICKQRDHKWTRILEPLWPYRAKCEICGAIGELKISAKKTKILPIKS